MIALGMLVAFMGASGWLGGMKHHEQDLDTIAFFMLGGLGIAALGFILLMWAAIRSRRAVLAGKKQDHDSPTGRPGEPRLGYRAAEIRHAPCRLDIRACIPETRLRAMSSPQGFSR
jgi:hypothetical protein